LTQRIEHLGADALGVRQVDGSGFVQLACGPGPSVLAELGRKLVQRRLDQRDRWVAAGLERLLPRPRQVPWVAASCLLVRRDAFAAVEGFDEGFFLFFEDIDFCLRLREVGRRVWYDPTVTILHHRGASAAHRPGSSAQHYRRSQLRFWGKHRGPWTRAAVGAYLRLRGVFPGE
jgi:GT2 family glycosyltransferase